MLLMMLFTARDQVRSGSIHHVQRMGMSRLLMVYGNALCCPVVAIVVVASAFSWSDDVDVVVVWTGTVFTILELRIK